MSKWYQSLSKSQCYARVATKVYGAVPLYCICSSHSEAFSGSGYSSACVIEISNKTRQNEKARRDTITSVNSPHLSSPNLRFSQTVGDELELELYSDLLSLFFALSSESFLPLYFSFGKARSWREVDVGGGCFDDMICWSFDEILG